jgi:hypothetical protein
MPLETLSSSSKVETSNKFPETGLIEKLVGDHLLRNMSIAAAEWTLARTSEQRKVEIESAYELWREDNPVWPVPLEDFFKFLEESLFVRG